MRSDEIVLELLSPSDAVITDENRQTTSTNNKRYYLVNLLQFLCHTYHLHWEPSLQTKVVKKPT